MADITAVTAQEEIAAVAALARDVWTEHYVPIIGKPQVDYMLQKFQSPDAIAGQIAAGNEYYTVSREGRRAGYMALVTDADNYNMMLSKIYVRRPERGHGLGRAMLDFAEALCRERRVKALWLTVNKNNGQSIAWYQRMGFVNTESIVQDIGAGFVMDDYRLEKKVDRIDNDDPA